MIDCIRDFVLVCKCLSVGRLNDHLCVRHHLRKILITHLPDQCQKHILRQIIHAHTVFIQLIEHCLIGICVFLNICRRNLLLLDQVRHILPNRKCIIRHICHRDIFEIGIRIAICLPELIFHRLDQTADRLCKCHTIIFNRKCIANMQIAFLRKCICNPHTIGIVRVEILTLDQIRGIHFIFFH